MADFEAFRAGDARALGRILVVIRAWLLEHARRLAPRQVLHDPEDFVQEALANLLCWYGHSTAQQRPATIPGLLAYARTTLKHVIVRVAKEREPARLRQHDAESAMPVLIDPLRKLLETVRAWERSPPAAIGPRLEHHLASLIELTIRLGGVPAVNQLRRGLGLSWPTASRVHAEFLALLERELRGHQPC